MKDFCEKFLELRKKISLKNFYEKFLWKISVKDFYKRFLWKISTCVTDGLMNSKIIKRLHVRHLENFGIRNMAIVQVPEMCPFFYFISFVSWKVIMVITHHGPQVITFQWWCRRTVLHLQLMNHICFKRSPSRNLREFSSTLLNQSPKHTMLETLPRVRRTVLHLQLNNHFYFKRSPWHNLRQHLRNHMAPFPDQA